MKVKELNGVLQAIAEEEKSFADDARAMAVDTKRMEKEKKKRCLHY
jgi:hypothetical protein